MRNLLSRLPILAGGALLLGACGAAAPAAPEPGCTPVAIGDLRPGEYASLSAAEAACFQLSGRRGAEYVLAAFDARAVDAARHGPEPALHDAVAYVVDDGSSQARPAAAQSRHDAAVHGHVRHARGTAAADAEPSPFARRTPWREGERFPVHRIAGTLATARVLRTFDGFAFAVIEDEASGRTDKLIAETHGAMEFLLRDGLASMVRAYGAERPVTSEGAGQLLVLFGSWNPDNGAGATWTHPAGGGTAHSYVWINLDVRPDVNDRFRWYDFPTNRLKVLAHELAHAWQARHLAETGGGSGPAWGAEGAADLLAMDAVRRFLEIGFASNWAWSGRLSAPNRLVAYALEPADTRGRVARGYFDAANLLRDLQARLIRQGMSEADALALVARGAVEGWHGREAGAARPGLAGRVRPVLGAGWEPDAAVLLWTLTQALDDATSNPELNDPGYRDAAAAGSPHAWPAAASTVTLGRAFSRSFQSPAGASAFVRIVDGGEGGVVSARASHDGARWMIARGR